MSMSAQADLISTLPNDLLVRIVSCLPFKECVRTSVLSKRWRHQHRDTTNLGFKESDFVSPYLQGRARIDARQRFVDFVFEWVDRVQHGVVEGFEISLSNPVDYLQEVQALIAFAVRKQVKNLAIDFSSHVWRRTGRAPRDEVVVEVPPGVYNLTSLESLTVIGCKGFDPTRFADPGIFKSLSLGWMKLYDLDELLSKAFRLETLSLNHCWGIYMMDMAGGMREVSIENCDLPYVSLSFDLPRVDIFKYTGDIFCLQFDKMNTTVKEIHLDFRKLIRQCDNPSKSNIAEGGMICDILNDLKSHVTLTLCPYLLQVIPESIHREHFLRPMKTKHLVLKTWLNPKEFNGIMILLSNCPDLETLTFDILPPTPSSKARKNPPSFDPKTYWMKKMRCICLMKTLKVVVVKNFVRGRDDLNVLKFLIRSGAVLERVELYVPFGVDEDKKRFVDEGAEMLQRSSKHVHVPCAQYLRR
ncbi:unnamed protein product [Thlaspi arvense]|uniref:F-box domain-containing protein n=1 Tax=Thlaspi arvense TaxID=13288 RepID=A0AAU9SRQ1_THLAR|nr:unnamed protein product [Thlaspi arvense]